MQYLAQKYAPELLGGTPARSAEIDMVFAQMKDVKQTITGPCYLANDRRKLINLAKQKMEPLIAYLGKKDFLLGEDLTFIDFYMLELVDFVEWLSEQTLLSAHKPLTRYVKRMKALKRVKVYMKSEKYLEKPFNNKVAKINNL